MKRLISLCLVTMACLLVSACTSPTPAAPAAAQADRVVPAGFSADVHAVYADGRGRDSARWPAPQPLFARDLSNADMAPGAWAFNADGVLAPTRSDGAKSNGDLWTKASYGDFVVSLEFRARENSDSGVFIRTTDIANRLQNSMEIQIRQGDEEKPVLLVGAILDVAAPARQVTITPGEWYRYVITAQGNTITVVLNGEPVNKVDLNQWKEAGKNPDGSANPFTAAGKDLPRAGRIGLQDQGTAIEFRNLFVEQF
jgi:Domain of Unknown Function (DUF1080)